LAQEALVEFLVHLTELSEITQYFHLLLAMVAVMVERMILQAVTAVQVVALVVLEAEFDQAELQHQGKEMTADLTELLQHHSLRVQAAAQEHQAALQADLLVVLVAMDFHLH
jgi:hypothetical protein